MPRYIKAKQGLKHSVIYTDTSGKMFRYYGGTWTWRNHNPGNLRPGSVSRKFNQIGVAGGFAVFPDYNTGLQAMIYLLRHYYQNFSIDKMAQKYAPRVENNTANYASFLRQKTGIKDNRKIKNFTAVQFKKLWQAVIQMEGYKKVTITQTHEITAVRHNTKHISAYHVKGLGWVTKRECISLARKRKINAVICRSRSGNIYLRSRPDHKLKNNFSNMITE